VLAFGLGLVFGLTLDTVPTPEVATAPAATATRTSTVRDDTVRDDETLVADRRGPEYRQRPATGSDADEPMQAEREAAHDAQPKTATVGPRTNSEE
jgi:hypothetical protein